MRRGQRHRRRPLLPAPGVHQPTSLERLHDGQEIYVYKDRDGVLVTDDFYGSTRPVADVRREFRPKIQSQATPSDSTLHADTESSVSASKELLDTTTMKELSITNDSSLAQPTSLVDTEQHVLALKELLDTSPLEGQRLRRRPPLRAPGVHQPTSLERLDDGQEIYVYKDRDGVLVTDDFYGSTRPVDDVRREFRPKSQSQARPSDSPLHADTEANVLASKELLDATALKESSSITNDSSLAQPTSLVDTEPHVLALKELLDTSPLEESSITNASSLPQTTSPLKDELILTPQLLQALDKGQASANLFLTHPSDNAYHYWALEEPDLFSSNELFTVMATSGKSTITDASSTRAPVAAHSPTPPISARKPTDWNHQFFIRVDLAGVVHTYPKLGGPFRSLEEAETAILLHLDEIQDPKMCTDDGLSESEIAIRDALYWPDGTSKYSSRSNPDEDHMGLLVQALLDKYNEEKTVSEDRAYQVEKVVSFQEVYEGDAGWYYHLNCTRKTEGGADNLFFAEVSKMICGELEEFELTCLHMLKSGENGTCYGCINDTIGMKHPIDAGKYKGGHDRSWPRGYGSHPLDFPDVDKDDPLVFPKDVDAWRKAHEERIRCLFQDDDVAKSVAARTPACADMSQGRRLKYVVPARRQLV